MVTARSLRQPERYRRSDRSDCDVDGAACRIPNSCCPLQPRAIRLHGTTVALRELAACALLAPVRYQTSPLTNKKRG